MFDMEYWPLEQAKLGTATEKPLAGEIAVITGGGGAIGAATAKAFAAAGAEVALLDCDARAAANAAKAIGTAALAVKCDVTDAASVGEAFARVVAAFGGVDIVVSNAGAAWQGRIGEVDEDDGTSNGHREPARVGEEARCAAGLATRRRGSALTGGRRRRARLRRACGSCGGWFRVP